MRGKLRVPEYDSADNRERQGEVYDGVGDCRRADGKFVEIDDCPKAVLLDRASGTGAKPQTSASADAIPTNCG